MGVVCVWCVCDDGDEQHNSDTSSFAFMNIVLWLIVQLFSRHTL